MNTGAFTIDVCDGDRCSPATRLTAPATYMRLRPRRPRAALEVSPNGKVEAVSRKPVNGQTRHELRRAVTGKPNLSGISVGNCSHKPAKSGKQVQSAVSRVRAGG